MRVVLGELASWAAEADDEFLDGTWFDLLARYGPDAALREALSRWAAADPRPLVLLIDEIDALEGDSLLSVLRQLRSGYVRRPAAFPQSVVPRELTCAVQAGLTEEWRGTSTPTAD